MRKREVIFLNQLLQKIARLKYLKALLAGFVVLLAGTFTLTMVEDAPSLSVKSHLLYHKCVLFIGVKLNTFVPIVLIHFIFGKSEELS